MELSTGWIVFVVYLMGQMDSIISFFLTITFCGFLLLVALGIGILCNMPDGYDIKHRTELVAEMVENRKKIIKCVKLTLVLTLIAFATGTLLPNKETTKEMAISFGAAEVLQSDAAKNVATEISKIAGKTADVVNKKLDKALEEK
jgi:hypothetical protein